VANIAGMVNIVRVKVGVNLIPIKLIHYNQQLEWVEWRTEDPPYHYLKKYDKVLFN